MKKTLFVATVPGSSQVNRDCVTTKERPGENSITAAMNVGKRSLRKTHFDGHMNAHVFLCPLLKVIRLQISFKCIHECMQQQLLNTRI